jgi:hypothetical protein
MRTGDVVNTILKEAEEQNVDLIAMPTAGHYGFLDAVRTGHGACRARHDRWINIALAWRFQ